VHLNVEVPCSFLPAWLILQEFRNDFGQKLHVSV
jgi:hypothetical protein